MCISAETREKYGFRRMDNFVGEAGSSCENPVDKGVDKNPAFPRTLTFHMKFTYYALSDVDKLLLGRIDFLPQDVDYFTGGF